MLSKRNLNGGFEIPPTVVGGLFKSLPKKGFEVSTHYGGWDYRWPSGDVYRKDVNDPPTAVGGISRLFCAKPLETSK